MKAKLSNENIPPYLDVYNSLYSDITNGVYQPHEYLPGETVLAKKYSVSRNTLRQALAILNEDGLIVKAQGKGTMVTPPPESAACDTITNPLIALCKRKITATHISYNYASPTEIARSKLGLTESDIVLACNCVYKADDINLGYSFIQIPAQYFKALNLNTANTDSIKEIITEGIFSNATQSDIIIKLVFANDIEVEFLGVSLDTPLLLIESLLLDETLKPFARCKFYFIPEHYHLTFSIK